jgi:NADH dehydrogenase (ubiquinone) 1 alpha subcomplex subunit 12
VYKDKNNYNVTTIPPEWHGWINYVNDYPPTTVSTPAAG